MCKNQIFNRMQFQRQVCLQYRVRLHFANKCVLRRRNWDLTLESSRQDPKINEILTLQHSGKDPSNQLCAEKKWQGNQLGHCTRTCSKVQVLISRVLQTASREQCFFTSYENFERERKFIVNSGASLHVLSKSNLTLEEPDTTGISKDPSVIMTANGTTHTTEEATEYVSDLDMFVQVQFLKDSPTVLSLGNCERETFTEWRPGQPSYLIKNGRKHLM